VESKRLVRIICWICFVVSSQLTRLLPELSNPASDTYEVHHGRRLHYRTAASRLICLAAHPLLSPLVALQLVNSGSRSALLEEGFVSSWPLRSWLRIFVAHVLRTRRQVVQRFVDPPNKRMKLARLV
jgi:hypothetical protein